MAIMSKLDKVSVPKNDNTFIECFITNYDYKKISLQFTCHMDSYLKFVKELTDLYQQMPRAKSLESLSPHLYSIKDDLFVFSSDGQYYRVQILEQWKNQKYMIYLLDEGLKFFADASHLFLLDEKFFNEPTHGFSYCVYVDPTLDSKYKYIVNYILQKTIVSFDKFFIKFDSTNEELIHLYYKNKMKKIIAVNDLIKSIFNDFNVNEFDQECFDDKLDQYIRKYPGEEFDDNSSNDVCPVKMDNLTIVETSVSNSGDEINGKMKIKQIISPGRFYVKRLSDDSFVQFKNELNDYFAKNKPIPVKSPSVNTIYVAEHNDKWHRVLVCSIDDSSDEITGFLLDKGYENCYSANELFELPNNFRQYSARAFAATLDLVKPNKGIDWDEEAIDYFSNLLCNQIVEFQSNGFDEKLQAERCILIVNNENIADLMFENGFAECALDDSI